MKYIVLFLSSCITDYPDNWLVFPDTDINDVQRAYLEANSGEKLHKLLYRDREEEILFIQKIVLAILARESDDVPPNWHPLEGFDVLPHSYIGKTDTISRVIAFQFNYKKIDKILSY
jgi:hypothetical protein